MKATPIRIRLIFAVPASAESAGGCPISGTVLGSRYQQAGSGKPVEYLSPLEIN
jgi:hypothetical protein